MEDRFRELAENLGYEIVPISTRINGIIERRADVEGVEKAGDFVMVVPRRMFGFPVRSHRDLLGSQHPDYFTCEKVLLRHYYGK
jgi:hypothetical protein